MAQNPRDNLSFTTPRHLTWYWKVQKHEWGGKKMLDRVFHNRLVKYMDLAYGLEPFVDDPVKDWMYHYEDEVPRDIIIELKNPMEKNIVANFITRNVGIVISEREYYEMETYQVGGKDEHHRNISTYEEGFFTKNYYDENNK
jgi:hypothetical protein